jgi:uncharacterized protein YlzI (FlbEa/FlbD family)
MRFIELNDCNDEPMLISVHHIMTIQRHEKDDTQITMLYGSLYVKETPDEILLKIRG